MKRNIQLIMTVVGVSALANFGAFAQASSKDSLSFSVTEAMTNEGVESNATGSVTAAFKEKGAESDQHLTISANGLTPGATYHLFAQLLGGGADPVDAGEFVADGNGALFLQFKTNSAGKGKGPGDALPPVLDPISHIQQMGIGTLTTNVVVVDTNFVLTVDFATPDKFVLSVTRDLSSGGVTADASAKATDKKASFQLKASGLAASTDYLFVINDVPVGTVTTDSKGKLKEKDSPPPLDVWQANSIALWDTSSNVVAGASLR